MTETATRKLPAVAHRWPSILGLVVAGLILLDGGDARDQGIVVFLAALIYLGTAVLDRPATVWPLFLASVVAVGVVKVLDLDPWPGLIGGAICLVALGLVGGLLGKPWLTAAQVPFMVVFGAAALLALTLSPQAGALLVAAALIGHAVQDVLVWRANQVVARSLAEFCFVLDFTVGLAIVVMSL